MIEPIAPGLPELPPDPIPPSPAQRPAGQVDLEVAKATLRRLRAALIATSDRLDVPYTDGPEWTPWSRYINPAMSALDETFDALLADLDAAREERASIIAAGELMLAEVREERDEWRATVRRAMDAIKRGAVSAGEIALAICSVGDGPKTVFDEMAEVKAELERARPVLEAARALRSARRTPAGELGISAEYHRAKREHDAAVDTYETQEG